MAAAWAVRILSSWRVMPSTDSISDGHRLNARWKWANAFPKANIRSAARPARSRAGSAWRTSRASYQW